MRNVDQFITWAPVQFPDEPKPRKIPCNGGNAHDPANWMSYAEAKAASPTVGFVLTEDDPYFCIDLDHCLQADGTCSQVAHDICALFPGAYIEVSHSGDGLHIFARGVMPDGFKHKNSALGVEVYDRLRFIAITGTNAKGTPDVDHQAALNEMLTRYMETTAGVVDLTAWTTGPRADWSGPDDDDELINRMMSARPSADALWNGKATVRDLWLGNVAALIDAYPDNQGSYDKSSADAALFAHLAFWTGCNCERMDRLFRRSGLVRDKYTSRPDYAQRTILKAAAMCENVYSDPRATNEVLEQEFIDDAHKLSQATPSPQVNDLLHRLRDSPLGKVARANILKIIKQNTGISLPILRSELFISDDDDDLATRVALRVEAELYANGNHIIRNQFGTFYIYDGKCWATKTDEQISNEVLGVIERSDDLGNANRSQLLKNAVTILAIRNVVQSDVLRLTSEPPAIINCDNGELHFDGFEFKPHSYDSYLRYVLNVPYAPEAGCPRVDAALLDIFANSINPPDMVRHLYELIGYAIQPNRFIPSFFIWQGQGRNGKSLITGLIERLMHSDLIYSGSVADLQTSRFALGYLQGKLLLVDDDVNTGQRLPDGMLKKISERKLLTGERKNKDPFQFIVTVLPILLTNNYPNVSDLTHGLRRRAFVIPFNRTFSDDEANPNLLNELCSTELPGLLNNAIEGLQRLRQRGRFEEPADCLLAKQTWLEEANPLPAFIAECCFVGASCSIRIHDFYLGFQAWCDANGQRSCPTRKVVKANLLNLGFREHRMKDGVHIIGITVSTPLSH